jgi:hypothetical protein
MFDKFRNAWEKLAYLPTGEFSVTRLISVTTFFIAIFVGLFGLTIFLINGKVLPNNLYTYFGSLAGGGFVQYGITKFTSMPSNNSGTE